MALILITGTSTGFGARSARRLAERGHRVVAGMRATQGANSSAAARLEAEAREREWSLSVVELDVTSDASVTRAVESVLAGGEAIDVLVNNAGVWGPGAFEAFTMEQWQETIDTNLIGSVRVARAVLPSMRARGRGFILQVSSLQGRFVLPYSAPYVASKHAVEGAFDTLRYELVPFGIEVTLLQPFDFATEMKAKAREHAAADVERTHAYGIGRFIEETYLTTDPSRSGDPELVVDAIRDLIEAPSPRPGRVTVANPLAQIETINRLADEMHEQLLPMIGLERLLPRHGSSAGDTPPGAVA